MKIRRENKIELVGIQVGKVQTHDYNGKDWVTGYMKKPVTGEVFVGEINVEGDEQHHKYEDC